jgi:hypothetical protein
VLVLLVVGWSSIVVVQMFSDSIYAPSLAHILVAIFVHDRPVYNVCPDVLITVCETSNGNAGGFNRIR